MLPDEIFARAQRIKLLLTDCDGVLTDGGLYFTKSGTEEIKVFHIHDGLGFKLARQAGLKTGIISGRKSKMVKARARALRIDYLYQGNDDKLGAYEAICAAENLPDEAIAYIGDDLHDLPLLQRVGFAIAVANAVNEVKIAAHFITEKSGGHGAAREAIEFILKAQNKWDELMQQFH